MSGGQGDVDESKFQCGHLAGSVHCEMEYSRGYGAGWRNDELIGEKLKCFMAGYESGQTAKAQFKERADAAQRRPNGS